MEIDPNTMSNLLKIMDMIVFDMCVQVFRCVLVSDICGQATGVTCPCFTGNRSQPTTFSQNIIRHLDRNCNAGHYTGHKIYSTKTSL